MSFGNASPAFMYNQKIVGTKYNEYVPNLKWSQASPTNEQRIKCYIESLFMMIRTKVVQEGASIQQTQIKWFYPISMSAFKKGLFERLWTAAYKKYFNPTGVPTSITESVAPYSFFQKTRSDVTNIVTIDIGVLSDNVKMISFQNLKVKRNYRKCSSKRLLITMVILQRLHLSCFLLLITKRSKQSL